MTCSIRFVLPDTQIRKALITAVDRAVDVKVMDPGAHIDVPMVRLASRHHYAPLLKGGVRIFEYQPTMLHAKTVIVDDLFSTIGSINFDERSMSTNAEESLAFYDRPLAGSMEAMFQRDLERCDEVTYEAWKHRGVPGRVMETFSWIWEPYY